MEQKIKNLTYFRTKLKTFIKDNEFDGNSSEKELKIKFSKMVSDIDKHLDNLKNDPLYRYKSEFLGILNDLREETDFNKSLDKPIKTDMKPFNERAYSKLNYIFRKNKLLADEEAKQVYSNYDMVLEKYNIFLELINWLNDNNLLIIPEKTLFSAYLGISVETYNDILKKATDVKVRNLFTSIDEYFTTNQFGALINNDRKSLERIQKTETYGQEMRQTQPDTFIDNSKTVVSYSEILSQIESRKKKYNSENTLECNNIKEIEE